jgi:hypothetical protein
MRHMGARLDEARLYGTIRGYTGGFRVKALGAQMTASSRGGREGGREGGRGRGREARRALRQSASSRVGAHGH